MSSRCLTLGISQELVFPSWHHPLTILEGISPFLFKFYSSHILYPLSQLNLFNSGGQMDRLKQNHPYSCKTLFHPPLKYLFDHFLCHSGSPRIQAYCEVSSASRTSYKLGVPPTEAILAGIAQKHLTCGASVYFSLRKFKADLTPKISFVIRVLTLVDICSFQQANQVVKLSLQLQYS